MNTTPKPRATKKRSGELGPPPPPPLPEGLEVAAEAVEDAVLVGADDRIVEDMAKQGIAGQTGVVCSQPQRVLRSSPAVIDGISGTTG